MNAMNGTACGSSVVTIIGKRSRLPAESSSDINVSVVIGDGAQYHIP